MPAGKARKAIFSPAPHITKRLTDRAGSLTTASLAFQCGAKRQKMKRIKQRLGGGGAQRSMNVAYSDPRTHLVVQRPFFRGPAEHKITPEVAEKRSV